MAVLIKGFKYPKRCMDCKLSTAWNGSFGRSCKLNDFLVTDDNDWRVRHPDCPLVLCEDDRVPCVDESLTDIMEEGCKYCKHPGWYKDPDDMQREQCDHCKVVEKLAEALYGRK